MSSVLNNQKFSGIATLLEAEKPQRTAVRRQPMVQSKMHLARISIPTPEGLQMLDTEDIIKCIARDRNTEIITTSGSSYLVAQGLKDYEHMLADFNFFRIHHSCLINLRHVNQYIRGDGGQVVMSDGHRCEVSRRKKTGLLNRLSMVML